MRVLVHRSVDLADLDEDNLHVRALSAPGAHPRTGRASWSETLDLVGEVDYEARRNDDRVTIRAEATLTLPWLSVLLWPIVAHTLRGRAVRELDTTRRIRKPWWAPPAPITPEEAAPLAVLCVILAIVSYQSTLFTQTAGFFTDSFGVGDTALTTAAALTRLGTILAVGGSILADRRGRRRILLAALIGTCVATGLSAAAPNLTVFTILQLLVRSFVNLAAGIAAVALVEDAPEGTRAYVLSLSSIVAGLGLATATVLLVVGDLNPEAWRVLFVVGGLAILTVPRLARQLPESRRFEELAARHARTGRLREIATRRYGRRFLILVTAVFLLQLAAAPSTQLMNRFLQNEREFTASMILVLRALTQGPIILVAIFVGGRLAESAGRKPLSIIGTVAAAAATGAFYLATGGIMWLLLLVATISSALSGPAWGALTTEMFPTEVRGSSTGLLLVAGVAGSITGLTLVGALEGPLGSLGAAIAATAIAPIVAALFLLPFLPESRGRDLDDVSPPLV